MIKKVALICLSLFLGVYIVFAIVFVNPLSDNDRKCESVEVDIEDNSENVYFNEAQILSYLNGMNLNPQGKNLSVINVNAIKAGLEENRLIKKANVYKTIDGSVKIEIFQRTPVLRIMSDKGNYYIDNEGQVMPVPLNFAAYLPLATGNINEEYAKDKLYEFALYIQKDKFWNAQIEQIYVTQNKDIELIPRVGNHQIILGKIEDYKENLDKLKLFYDKGLNKIGWNRYSIINLKFKDQVVCTKR
ncbi:cell division protein FtsQ [Dysgonomonadaceae bacterium PH5-43]|nr:cell division protein FtsQ [Dysgonomonadaceae bacterium PH5-43]